MYCLVVLYGSAYKVFQLIDRSAACDAYLLRQFLNAVYGAIPDNVINVYVVSKKIFFVVVHINDSDEAFSLLPEKIEERAVLSVVVTVAWVVRRAWIIAGKYEKPAAHQFFEGFPSGNISFFVKHIGF